MLTAALAIAFLNAPLRTKPLATVHTTTAAAAHKAKPAAPAKKAKKPAAPVVFDPANPLGPVASGLVQCYAPDVAKKTCASLSEYRDNGDGSYANIASVLISATPPAVLKTITPVKVVDGAICGQIRQEDITAGTLTINGSLYAADAAAPILAKVATGMSSLYGHDICTSYSQDGKVLTAKVTFDGNPHPPDNAVVWVDPADGYKVAPSDEDKGSSH